MRLGIIADDFTGATDIAGFLVANGLGTIQLNGVPDAARTVTADAVVISLKSRSAPVAQAVAESLAALEWLMARDCEQVFFKYCSTFDSTPQGNIGPVTDALMAAMGETFTVICPALPVNGRTIYQGYLFVGDVPMNESGMRHHPVNPMTDANLMRLMQAQSEGKAGNVPYAVVERGADAVRAALEELKAAGVRYAVLDALNADHLKTLGAAVSGMRLVTGGAGLADGICMADTAGFGDPADAEAAGRPGTGRTILLSGSCSQMTNRQVAAYAAVAPVVRVSVDEAIADSDGYAGRLLDAVKAVEGGAYAPLVSATVGPEALADIQSRLGAQAASAAVEHLFHALARRLEAEGFQTFIVAGGETSGTVTQALEIGGFHIGPRIAPGVPFVRAVDKPISLALKSGNFGQERFFFEAQDLARAAPSREGV
ncbi:membrane protein [Aureimonas altamirensis]|uniref:3-oxo-tetronate kinase n=1 Tax=Aureimonas altamirensis TaxID=370622 RepID=A0A0B1QAG8_9HYPH|nr:3-oxo-tetronate kinase [Aureimonas altamirensis]KHJ55912.1 membrane protein [Aureimonas altamirensis]